MLEMTVAPTLPVIQAVNDASDLNAVTDLGERSVHPLLQEIRRIGNIQFLGDRLTGLLGKFALNRGVQVNRPISQEVDRIEHLYNFDDQLQRATSDARSSWGLGSLRHSVTMLPNELGDMGTEYLTVHTTLTGGLLYVEIEHTVDQAPRYDVVHFNVGLADGRPLPSCLSFDARSGVLTGIPPAGGETIHLQFTAELDDGTVFSGQVEIEPDTARIIELKHCTARSSR
jgi:hypothetical protein